MVAVIQRVTGARVTIGDEVAGIIGPGLVVLLAVGRDDTDADAQWMTSKITSLRVFPSSPEKGFDRDVTEVGGQILLISNFTVAAYTKKGRRPSFDPAMPPDLAKPVFEKVLSSLRATGIRTETGRFGADMQVTLTNDGPVTFILDSRAV
jgi:D-tyrosyl-tRNA(Tyr) deacylase